MFTKQKAKLYENIKKNPHPDIHRIKFSELLLLIISEIPEHHAPDENDDA